MKQLLLQFIFAVSLISGLTFTSCTKTDTITKTVTDTVTVTKTIIDTLIVAPHSIMDLFTQKQWYWDTAIVNYTGTGTGSLYYARHSSSNVENFDSVRYVFWRGGTQDVFANNGTTWYSQTWEFTNADSTNIYYPPLSTRPNPVYQRILHLDANNLIIYDSTASLYGHYITNP